MRWEFFWPEIAIHTPENWIDLGFAGVLGLCLGSFLNVCLDRLHLAGMNEAQRQKFLAQPQISERLKIAILQGRLSLSVPARSFCFACGHDLAWVENLPVFSYLLNRGQCLHCGVHYGARSAWVEVACGFGAGGLYALCGHLGFTFWIGLHLGWAIVACYLLRHLGRVPASVAKLGMLFLCFDLGLGWAIS